MLTFHHLLKRDVTLQRQELAGAFLGPGMQITPGRGNAGMTQGGVWPEYSNLFRLALA